MLKNARFNRIIGTAALASFTLTSVPCMAYSGGNLSPQSFSQMYSLAQKGEVEALRASVRRGMNIDSVNENGDTGLCIAAQQHDAHTYNVFRASGANPRHPCTQKISHYSDFVNSSSAVSFHSTSREAFSTLGKEKFSISPTTWWVLGGLAVGGGIAALAMGGGGGGGGSGSDTSDENSDSLGKYISSKGYIGKKTIGNESNSTKFDIKNSKTKQIQTINFNKSVLTGAEYLDTALRAENSGSFNNLQNTVLQLGAGTVGMVAEDNASVVNNGYINADAYNAAIGMIASGNSEAVNNGKGIVGGTGTNGIDMNFSGYADSNMIIGMYADTNSSLINNGDIQGSAILASPAPSDTSSDENGVSGMLDDVPGEDGTSSSSATSTSVGTIAGMKTMIINTGSSLSNKVITALNAGNIDISAGDGGTDNEIKVNIIGMTSALDDGFLNGSKNISRAEKSSLNNTGTIRLSYTGNYTAAAKNTLRKGLGGVVGMRSDANTTATNNGNIFISLTSDNSASGIDVAAGMQSVHGGVISNNADGTITIQTASDNNRITYGMLSVEGSGTVSGLYVTNQNIKNTGAINMYASNSYGMASFNGGTLTNSGHIILGSKGNTLYNSNIGMYGSNTNSGVRTSLINQGTIDVYSHKSTAMKNDYPGDTVITNDGTINIFNDAVDSYVFGGKYSQLVNNGIINYSATPTNTSSELKNSGHFAVVSTKSADAASSSSSSSSSSSTTENIINNKTINIYDASGLAAMAVETKQGVATNNGTITLNGNAQGNTINQVGMVLGTDTINIAKITNVGSIVVSSKYSAAMASYTQSTAAMINASSGVIDVRGDNSYGMYSTENSLITNDGTINLYGKNAVAFYTAGSADEPNKPQISNNRINVYGDNAIAFYIAGKADITSPGVIEICPNGSAVCDENARKNLTYYYVDENGDLTLSEGLSINDGTLVSLNGGTVTIKKDTSFVLNNNGTLIKGAGGTLKNNGELFVYGTNSYGINLSDDTTVENSGKITIAPKDGTIGSNNYGIYSSGKNTIKNSGEITVTGSSSAGIYIFSGDADITNSGTITVTGDNSYGIYVPTGSSTVTNTDTITVTGNNSYGIDAGDGVTVDNQGTIEVSGSNSYGIYARGEGGSVTNSATIKITGSGSYGMWAAQDGGATNNGIIIAQNGAKDKNICVEEADTTSGASAANFLMATRGGVIRNTGTIITDNELDFNQSSDGTGIIEVNNSGTYQAAGFSGTIAAGADITQKGFEKTYRNTDSFIGKDNGLTVVSGSYLFDAAKEVNSDGNIDVVMSMRAFDDVMSNKNLADFLNQNYDGEKGEEIFNILKGQRNEQLFNQVVNEQFGFNIVPNFAKQNLDVLQNINRNITDDLFNIGDEAVRRQVKAFTYKQEINAKHALMGYKDKVAGIYGFYDEKINNLTRLGYGVSAVRAESSYDNDSSRYNNIVEVFAPLALQQGNTVAVVKAKAGFGRGHYRRLTAADNHKADTEEYYYGVDASARHTVELPVVDVQPEIGFNVTGMYQDDIKESGNGLRIKDKNTVSAQSVLGLAVKKKIQFNNEHSLLLSAGGKYYHEFGDKYRTKASVSNMDGFFDIVDPRLQRDYGLLSLKAQYDYKNISFNASANVPLAQKHNAYYLLGLGYKF